MEEGGQDFRRMEEERGREGKGQEMEERKTGEGREGIWKDRRSVGKEY